MLNTRRSNDTSRLVIQVGDALPHEEPKGKISKEGNEKLSYGTMMKIRTLIMESASKMLGQSLTICTRYSLIRC